jgi:hypothetical protein
MVSKIQSVEIQLNGNIVMHNESVHLTAPLSELELQHIEAQRGKFRFMLDGRAKPLDMTGTNPPTATWKVENAKVGEYRASLMLDMDGKERTIGQARIYVVEKLKPLDFKLPETVEEGTIVGLTFGDGPLPFSAVEKANLHYEWDTGRRGEVLDPSEDVSPPDARWDTSGVSPGVHSVTLRLLDERGRTVESVDHGPVMATDTTRITPSRLNKSDVLRVALQRPTSVRTRDQAFWTLIRSCTAQVSSARYADFIERVLAPDDASFTGHRPVIARRLSRDVRDLATFSYGVGAYEMLKTATQIFLLLESGGCHAEIKDVDLDDESARYGEPVTLADLRGRLGQYLTTGHIPYIDRVLRNAFPGEREVIGLQRSGVLASRVQVPCLLELIWSYWHEEGMLVQSIGAIARRFQNIRAPGGRDPLSHLDLDPLRPLSNLLWGYIQDEKNLLTVKRRAYEYDHQYGLSIYGKAVPVLRPADSRSKFLEAFHHLLHRSSLFYKEDNDTTVIADGFALLNALKEVHLLLAEGAGNQFGELTPTARGEMLIQQWLLSRPEMRDFLQGRRMVPYKEPWMAQVDTMKSLQGWTDIPITHFRDLGVYGEQILLTIRYGDWMDINNEDDAKNWARSWRPEIQSYLHAYRAVTGMDLTNADTVDHTMPAIHLQKRLAMQRAR